MNRDSLTRNQYFDSLNTVNRHQPNILVPSHSNSVATLKVYESCVWVKLYAAPVS